MTTTATYYEDLSNGAPGINRGFDTIEHDLKVFRVPLHERPNSGDLLTEFTKVLGPLIQQQTQVEPASVLLS